MKRLQIVRVDNDLVQKANLQIGNNIIGRGAATGCNDGQVLKHAVTINLSPNDEMTITPVTSCYMKPAGCTRWQTLKLDSSVPIKPGDVCSLLPDKCWFKIISVPEMMEDSNEQASKRKADEDLDNETDKKKACPSPSLETNMSPSKTLNDILTDNKLAAERHSSSMNGNGEHCDETAPVLQKIYSISSSEGSNVSVICSKISLNSQVETKESAVERKNSGEREARNVMSNIATSVDSKKRIKWDCGAHFSDQTEANSPIADEPRSSVVARCQDRASVSNPETLATPRREKCTYGARCYRKNPNHKNNYSHPGDTDYNETDDRQECPYGKRCYRKNPQHKAQFKHTSAPRHRRRAATPVQPVTDDTASGTDVSSVEESVEESDYEPSMCTESSDATDRDDSESEWEDGTTG